MDILGRIEEIRMARNMSIYELAIRSGISHNTIYRWYNLNYTPSLDSLQVFCEKGFEMQMVEFFAVNSNLIPATDDLKEIAELWFKLNRKQKEAVKNLIISYQDEE